MSAPEQPTTTLMLSVNAIIGGKFYGAGTPLPFTDENDLPASLKPFRATGEEPSTQPVERNIYDLPLSVRRQVRKLELAAAEKEWAEAQAAAPLREDVAAALEAEHDIAIGRAKAQMAFNQSAIDNAHAAAAAAAEPAPLFVRRGAVYKRCDATRLRPGEQFFAKRAGGWEYVGVINARGEPPPPEITP